MSKKKHQQPNQNHHHPMHMSEAGEYKVIGHDLVRLLILNAIYLAAILVVYYTNQSSHYLENLFSKLLHW